MGSRLIQKRQSGGTCKKSLQPGRGLLALTHPGQGRRDFLRQRLLMKETDRYRIDDHALIGFAFPGQELEQRCFSAAICPDQQMCIRDRPYARLHVGDIIYFIGQEDCICLLYTSQSLLIAKNMILAKVYNSKWILERAIRDYPCLLYTS